MVEKWIHGRGGSNCEYYGRKNSVATSVNCPRKSLVRLQVRSPENLTTIQIRTLSYDLIRAGGLQDKIRSSRA